MKAYLFDLDGTLIDSFEDIAVSANHARAALGLSPKPLPELFGYVGEGAQRLIERALGPEHADKVSEALALWRAHYDEHMLDRTRVYPGVLEALARLDGARAIVTNKPGPHARRLVQALGLAPLCPVVIGGGDVASRKPDPEGVRAALQRLGAVDEAVFVGDSRIDALTARAAGLPLVAVLWGQGTRAALESHGARVFAEKAEELPLACELVFGTARSG